MTPDELSAYEIGYEFRLQELREISIEQTYWMNQTLFGKKPPKIERAKLDSRKANGFLVKQEMEVDLDKSRSFAQRVQDVQERR